MRRGIEARAYAARKHSTQRRDGTAAEPYVNHVIDVAARVAQSPAAKADVIICGLGWIACWRRHSSARLLRRGKFMRYGAFYD